MKCRAETRRRSWQLCLLMIDSIWSLSSPPGAHAGALPAATEGNSLCASASERRCTAVSRQTPAKANQGHREALSVVRIIETTSHTAASMLPQRLPVFLLAQPDWPSHILTSSSSWIGKIPGSYCWFAILRWSEVQAQPPHAAGHSATTTTTSTRLEERECSGWR